LVNTFFLLVVETPMAAKLRHKTAKAAHWSPFAINHCGTRIPATQEISRTYFHFSEYEAATHCHIFIL
jgi:hypothetical protein